MSNPRSISEWQKFSGLAQSRHAASGITPGPAHDRVWVDLRMAAIAALCWNDHDQYGLKFYPLSQAFKDSRSFRQEVPFVVRLDMNRNPFPAIKID